MSQWTQLLSPSNLTLGMVVGRLDIVMGKKSPQCLLVVQNIGTRAGQVLDIGCDCFAQRRFNLNSHRGHPGAKRLLVEFAGLLIMPVLEQDAGVAE